MSIADFSCYSQIIWNPKNVTILNKVIKIPDLQWQSLEPIVVLKLLILRVD